MAPEFPFEILTPWYRTWWFIGACGVTPLLMAAAAVRWRMLGATQRERELVRMVEEKTVDLRRANEDLLRLSSLDPLTGLANRRVFDQTLEKECARLKRTGSAVSLVLLDVDHFKALNDSQGHQRGDEYLVRVGAELGRLARRHVDVAARYGGEEFALILPETKLPTPCGSRSRYVWQSQASRCRIPHRLLRRSSRSAWASRRQPWNGAVRPMSW